MRTLILDEYRDKESIITAERADTGTNLWLFQVKQVTIRKFPNKASCMAYFDEQVQRAGGKIGAGHKERGQ